MFHLTEGLSITLMPRFLNHLDLLDSLNSSSPDSTVSVEMQNEHADAVLRNLLRVGKFLGDREDVKWIGSKKRRTMPGQGSTSEDICVEAAAPAAFVVLMDKVCKIGRKCRHVLPIATCLKFYAAILVTCQAVLVARIDDTALEPAFISMLKLVDHVQTFTISRDQVRRKDWKSALELSAVLLDRLRGFLGADRHAALNLTLVKSMSAARIARKEEKRRLVMVEPEKAARMKAHGNQRKYKAKRGKGSDGKIKMKKKY